MNNATNDKYLQSGICSSHPAAFFSRAMALIVLMVLISLVGMANAAGVESSDSGVASRAEQTKDDALIASRDDRDASQRPPFNGQQVVPMGMVIKTQADGQSALVKTTASSERVILKQSSREPVRVHAVQDCKGVAMSREDARRRGPVCTP